MADARSQSGPCHHFLAEQRVRIGDQLAVTCWVGGHDRTASLAPEEVVSPAGDRAVDTEDARAYGGSLGNHARHGEVGCRHRRAKVPGDRDWAFTSMLDVVRLTEEQVRCAGSELADLLRPGEQEDVAARLTVVQVPLTSL